MQTGLHSLHCLGSVTSRCSGKVPAFRPFSGRNEDRARESGRNEARPCSSNKILEFPQTRFTADFVTISRFNLTSRDLRSLRLQREQDKIFRVNQTLTATTSQASCRLGLQEKFLSYNRRKTYTAKSVRIAPNQFSWRY